jgi:two-component system nitrogen regulation response regulator GlnG
MADSYITPSHLGILDAPGRTSAKQHEPDKELDSGVPLKEIVRRTVRQVEQEVITKVLRETHGNKAKAARVLQVDYKTLHTKVKQYGIEL